MLKIIKHKKKLMKKKYRINAEYVILDEDDRPRQTDLVFFLYCIIKMCINDRL